MTRSWSALWLEARGLPRWMAYPWSLSSVLFPSACVVCGRSWRPDGPEYAAVWGQVLPDESGGSVWSCPGLGLRVEVSASGGPVQNICLEHRDRWESVPDCRTGEMVEMVYPPSRLDRVWRDVVYWTRTVVRFVGLVFGG